MIVSHDETGRYKFGIVKEINDEIATIYTKTNISIDGRIIKDKNTITQREVPITSLFEYPSVHPIIQTFRHDVNLSNAGIIETYNIS